MAKADRVYITPPTNTPIDTHRRHFLAVAAGASVLSVGALAAAAKSGGALDAASAVDPIYAAIKRHRDLAKTCDAAWKVRARYKDFGTLTEAEKAQVLKLNDAVDEAHLPLEAAAMDLFNTHPTTLAGIIDALCYMRTQHRNDGVHMIKGGAGGRGLRDLHRLAGCMA